MDGNDWYEYCRSNPLRYVDPDGRTPYVVSYKMNNNTTEYSYFCSSRTYDLLNIGAGFLPFYATATWGCRKYLGFEEIDGKMFKLGATIATDIMQNFKYANNIKNVARIGKVSGYLNAGIGLYDLYSYTKDEDYVTDQLVGMVLGGVYLRSSTREGVLTKYAVLKKAIIHLIQTKQLSYEIGFLGNVTSYKLDQKLEESLIFELMLIDAASVKSGKLTLQQYMQYNSIFDTGYILKFLK